MAGNITKRGKNSWQVKVFLGRDPITGKQKFHTKTIKDLKKDAQAYLNRVLHQHDRGLWVEPTSETLGHYLDRWLTEVDTSRLGMHEHNEWVIRNQIQPVLGSIPLGWLTAFDIQGFYNGLTKQGLAGSSVRRFHNVLSSAVSMALRWGLIAKNPASDVQLPKVQKNQDEGSHGRAGTQISRGGGDGSVLGALGLGDQDWHAPGRIHGAHLAGPRPKGWPHHVAASPALAAGSHLAFRAAQE